MKWLFLSLFLASSCLASIPEAIVAGRVSERPAVGFRRQRPRPQPPSHSPRSNASVHTAMPSFVVSSRPNVGSAQAAPSMPALPTSSMLAQSRRSPSQGSQGVPLIASPSQPPSDAPSLVSHINPGVAAGSSRPPAAFAMPLIVKMSEGRVIIEQDLAGRGGPQTHARVWLDPDGGRLGWSLLFAWPGSASRQAALNGHMWSDTPGKPISSAAVMPLLPKGPLLDRVVELLDTLRHAPDDADSPASDDPDAYLEKRASIDVDIVEKPGVMTFRQDYMMNIGMQQSVEFSLAQDGAYLGYHGYASHEHVHGLVTGFVSDAQPLVPAILRYDIGLFPICTAFEDMLGQLDLASQSMPSLPSSSPVSSASPLGALSDAPQPQPSFTDLDATSDSNNFEPDSESSEHVEHDPPSQYGPANQQLLVMSRLMDALANDFYPA